MSAWKYKQGDTTPAHRSTLRDGAGNPVNLTDASSEFLLFAADDPSTPILTGADTGPDGAPLAGDGEVEYQWTYTETDALVGHFLGYHDVTFPNGKRKRFPTVGGERVYFMPAPDLLGS